VNNIQPDPLPFQLPSFRLSPDEKQLVQATRESGKTDYWIVNLARGTRTRLTFDNSARGWFCGWTPDGQRVMYASGNTPAVYKISLKAADGSGEAREFLNGLDASFSPDGKFVVYSAPERHNHNRTGISGTSEPNQERNLRRFWLRPKTKGMPTFRPTETM